MHDVEEVYVITFTNDPLCYYAYYAASEGNSKAMAFILNSRVLFSMLGVLSHYSNGQGYVVQLGEDNSICNVQLGQDDSICNVQLGEDDSICIY